MKSKRRRMNFMKQHEILWYQGTKKKKSTSDTEGILSEFMRNKLKIPASDESKVQFELHKS